MIAALAHLSVSERKLQRPHLRGFKFLSVGRTHAGRVRKLNEDAYLDRPDLGLWAVADGMGGHENGEVASAAVVQALSQIEAFSSAYAFRDAVSCALRRVNGELYAGANGRGATMGATIVALMTYEGHYACLWAGDSRAYLYRAGRLCRITKDHTLVEDLVNSGALSASRARSHPQAHVITRAVGAAPTLALDGAFGAIRAGDRFLLCSDGLSSVLTDRELSQIVARPPFEAATENLISKTLAAGAPDNVTAVLIGVEP